MYKRVYAVLHTFHVNIHIVTVGANVNTATTSNDHTVLSLACAGGHLSVVQYLLMQNADVGHVLKVCSFVCINYSYLYVFLFLYSFY